MAHTNIITQKISKKKNTHTQDSCKHARMQKKKKKKTHMTHIRKDKTNTQDSHKKSNKHVIRKDNMVGTQT